MVGAMLDTCPSFAPAWQAFLDEYRDEDDLPLYLALGDLARHLIGLVERDETGELAAVFRRSNGGTRSPSRRGWRSLPTRSMLSFRTRSSMFRMAWK
nr:hypothetical protein [Fimbriiglobus ruber]